jgi:hypothetical protein
MSALAEHGPDGGHGPEDGCGTDGDQGPGGGQGGAQTQTGQPPEPAARPRMSRRRRALIIGGFTLAVAVAVAAAAGIVSVTHHHSAPAPRPLRDTVFTLRPGQCLNSARNGINDATAIPCAQPHAAEIYGAFGVASHQWPGTKALAAQAHSGCLSRLSSYLNPELATTGMTLAYIYPDQGAWDTGTRTVICEIRSTHGQMTGSVRAFSGQHG